MSLRCSSPSVQFRSEPVFFVGLFARPGIYPLQGNRTLMEMLARWEACSQMPTGISRSPVTRNMVPFHSPTQSSIREKKVSTVEINLGSLRQNMNPAENILLQPYDASLGGPRRIGVCQRRGWQGRRHRAGRARLHFAPASADAIRRISKDAKKSRCAFCARLTVPVAAAVIEVNVSDLV